MQSSSLRSGKQVPKHARYREHLGRRQRLWWMSAMQKALKEGIMIVQLPHTTEKRLWPPLSFSCAQQASPTDWVQKYTKNTVHKLSPDESLGATGLGTLLYVTWVGYITNTSDVIVQIWGMHLFNPCWTQPMTHNQCSEMCTTSHESKNNKNK